MPPSDLALDVSPELPEVSRINSQLSDFCNAHAIPDEIQNDLLIACEEILSNVIRHSSATIIRVFFAQQPHSVELRITDNGPPFDPLARPDPDLSLGLDDRRPGGLGIFMVRQMMDEVTYTQEDAFNVFTMIKRLPAPRATDRT